MEKYLRNDMETLNIIVQTMHNETIFKEFRFSDGG